MLCSAGHSVGGGEEGTDGAGETGGGGRSDVNTAKRR